MRKTRDYKPQPETIKHVDEVLKLMSILTKDERFLEVQKISEWRLTNMCEVLDRMEEKGKAEGKAEGKTEGRIEELLSLVADGIISEEQAVVRCSLPEGEFRKKLEEYKK